MKTGGKSIAVKPAARTAENQTLEKNLLCKLFEWNWVVYITRGY